MASRMTLKIFLTTVSIILLVVLPTTTSTSSTAVDGFQQNADDVASSLPWLRQRRQQQDERWLSMLSKDNYRRRIHRLLSDATGREPISRGDDSTAGTLWNTNHARSRPSRKKYGDSLDGTVPARGIRFETNMPEDSASSCARFKCDERPCCSGNCFIVFGTQMCVIMANHGR